jgi:hypothetical protein
LAPGADAPKTCRKNILVLSMKMRRLMELVLRQARRGTGATGFELMLALSREHPGRYVIESIREIDRHTALEALSTFGLFHGSGEWGRGGTAEVGSGPRIRFIRITPRQALRMFGEIRKGDPNVRKLYAHLEARNLELVRDGARGAVMRAYAADGAVRGEGIVIELPHTREDGAEASFHVSVKDWLAGEGVPAGVGAEYEVRRGEQVETYVVRDECVRLVERVTTATPRRARSPVRE